MLILPYKNGSKSAKALARSLNIKMIRSSNNSTFFKSLIINWGNSRKSITSLGGVLNNPKYVKNAVNKLLSFQIFLKNNISIPDFTVDYNVAKKWIKEGDWVIARSLLESHGGKGITLAMNIEQLPNNSKIYVKYFKKSYEFRVHVFDGKVIDYIQKRKRNNCIDKNSVYNRYIRSHDNNWVFCRKNIIVDDNIKILAIRAVEALKLDFGACDIVMKASGEVKVLECNTAPALAGTTLLSYSNAIKEYTKYV